MQSDMVNAACDGRLNSSEQQLFRIGSILFPLWSVHLKESPRCVMTTLVGADRPRSVHLGKAMLDQISESCAPGIICSVPWRQESHLPTRSSDTLRQEYDRAGRSRQRPRLNGGTALGHVVSTTAPQRVVCLLRTLRTPQQMRPIKLPHASGAVLARFSGTGNQCHARTPPLTLSERSLSRRGKSGNAQYRSHMEYATAPGYPRAGRRRPASCGGQWRTAGCRTGSTMEVAALT